MSDRHGHWQYLNVVHDSITEDAEGFRKRLDVYGIDGWEAYAVTRNREYVTYHFKRVEVHQH